MLFIQNQLGSISIKNIKNINVSSCQLIYPLFIFLPDRVFATFLAFISINWLWVHNHISAKLSLLDTSNPMEEFHCLRKLVSVRVIDCRYPSMFYYLFIKNLTSSRWYYRFYSLHRTIITDLLRIQYLYNNFY